MKIDTRRALQYVLDHFNLSGEAIRMTDNLFQYINEHEVLDPISLILDVLDGFGFKPDDYNKMCQLGIIK